MHMRAAGQLGSFCQAALQAAHKLSLKIANHEHSSNGSLFKRLLQRPGLAQKNAPPRGAPGRGFIAVWLRDLPVCASELTRIPHRSKATRPGKLSHGIFCRGRKVRRNARCFVRTRRIFCA